MRGQVYGGIRIEKHIPIREIQLAEPGSYTMFAPQRVYLPLPQHRGVHCRAVVKPGQKVLLGQLVGESTHHTGTNVHASVSGTVLDVTDWPQADTTPTPTVVIQNDNKYMLRPDIYPYNDWTQMHPQEILDIIQQNGVPGMGVTVFPKHGKFSSTGSVNTCIINCAESEPGLAADDALMQIKADKIVRGCEIAIHAYRACQGIIAIAANKPAALRAIRAACRETSCIQVVELPPIYPHSSERQLLQSVLGYKIPYGGLAASVGAAVINASTAVAIADVLERGMPLVRRICTVTGDVAYPQNISFPIGSLASELIDFCGGFAGTPARVIWGGPMTGKALTHLDIPLSKASNGLVVINTKHDQPYRERACIRCNRCVEVCPMQLMPWSIDRKWRKKKLDACQRLHAESCINCGSCSYVCPAQRRLAKHITEARQEIIKRKELS